MSQKAMTAIDWDTFLENRNAYYRGLIAAKRVIQTGIIPMVPRANGRAENAYWHMGIDHGLPQMKLKESIGNES
jgi:hypothetical protein